MPYVPVTTDVTRYVEDVPGPADRTLLVVHGAPDWDCSYLREPLVELAGRTRCRRRSHAYSTRPVTWRTSTSRAAGWRR